MAKLLKGKPVADAILADVRGRADALRGRGVVPTLAVVRVGEEPGDLAYERTLLKKAAEAGVDTRTVSLDATVGQEVLEFVLRQVGEDPAIHGCLLFLPLPARLDGATACETVDPRKDVDGITRASLATVFCGEGVGFAPSTAEACIRVLDFYGIPLEGRRVTVVGRSLVVGRPLAQLLLARNATVTMCHSRTVDLAGECCRADIVISAMGRARALDADSFRPGQTVLDVGINFDDQGRMCGDVDAAAADSIVEALTPVPGGIGSVTCAVTLDHAVTAAERLLL